MGFGYFFLTVNINAEKSIQTQVRVMFAPYVWSEIIAVILVYVSSTELIVVRYLIQDSLLDLLPVLPII